MYWCSRSLISFESVVYTVCERKYVNVEKTRDSLLTAPNKDTNAFRIAFNHLAKKLTNSRLK